MSKKPLLQTISLLAAFAFIVTGCGGSSAQPAAAGGSSGGGHANVDLELLGASGTLSQASIGIADIVTKKHPWIRMSATGTSNSEANITQMLEKDPNACLYIVSAAPYISAKNAVGQFSNREPIKDQRMIAGLAFGCNGLVTLDENIKTMSDLDGRTVAMFADEMPQAVAKAAFEILGVSVEIKTINFNDQYNALSDGLVDACLYLGTGSPDKPLTPVSALQEVVANKRKKVYPISFPADLQQQAVEKAGLEGVWPYTPVVALPGSLHEEQTEPFELYGSTTVALACFAGADEELIYEITKCIAENSGDLKNYLSDLEGLEASGMLSLLHMIDGEQDIHPGALKYYQEAGLWPDAWEKANKHSPSA